MRWTGWMTLALCAALAACESNGGGGPGSHPPVPSLDPAGEQAAVVLVAAADRERLFDAALESVRPFHLTEEDREGGRIVSGDFGMIEAGVPRYRYIEVRLAPVGDGTGRYKVGVAVYLHEKRFADGSPLGREGEKFEWVYLGLDGPWQEELAQGIYRRYLEGR